MNLWPGSIEKIENDNTDIISNLSCNCFQVKSTWQRVTLVRL